jgi:hypothetical protein
MKLGPLKRATSRVLLGNYVVRRAVLAPGLPSGRGRSAESVLEVTASQGRVYIGGVVSACQPVAQAEVLAETSRVFLVEDPDIGSDPPFPSYGACDRTTGQQKLLYQQQESGEGYFYYLQGAAATGATVALAIEYADKYNDCSTTVDIYDFAKTAPLTAYQAGCTGVSALVVDDEGFAVWLETAAGMNQPNDLFVHDDAGTRQLDTGVIANVHLSGNTVSWTTDGGARQATLT